VMIFAGPCSPRFMADALVVSVNVGEGGPAPGEALGFGLVAEGLDVQSRPIALLRFGWRNTPPRTLYTFLQFIMPIIHQQLWQFTVSDQPDDELAIVLDIRDQRSYP